MAPPVEYGQLTDCSCLRCAVPAITCAYTPDMSGVLPITLTGKLGLAAGVAIGAAIVQDIARYTFGDKHISDGGSPHGTVTANLMGVRHVLGFGARNALHPRRLMIAVSSESQARKLEDTLFDSKTLRGYDNGPDAFRHIYGSALIAFRLVKEAGMTPAEAAAFARSAGLAHEEDSFLSGRHYRGSRTMDVVNNEVGIDIGVRAAVAGVAANDHLRLAKTTLDVIRGGQAVVLDSKETPPRASRPVDVTRFLRAVQAAM